MWVRGLKQFDRRGLYACDLSHPMWVRGLKLGKITCLHSSKWSHPMWVRGLKHLNNHRVDKIEGRTLCGCVD